MHSKLIPVITCCLLLAVTAGAQAPRPCTEMAQFKAAGAEITKATPVPAGTIETYPFGMGQSPALPAYCKVEGVINRRRGVGGEEFGIQFALALPESWNGDFLMQGGGGGNGIVAAPLGLTAAADKPALVRGFAVVSTDTGHVAKRGLFDFDFMRDQQAYLDFAYLANAQVASLAKQIIAQYYGKAAAYSYFAGCSTGGREGMVLSQRYPTAFNGIISGAPAMRTGLSNLAIGKWVPVTFNQMAPKDAQGKPDITQAITDDDRKLILSALLSKCDAKDGIADGMISDPMACDFEPAALACKQGQKDACLAPEKAAAIKNAMAGPKTKDGHQVYPGFLYDTGITASAPIRGILNPGPGIFGTPTTAMDIDVEKEAMEGVQPLADSMSNNLSTFSANGGKLMFFHGDSDPWFSALDTLFYFVGMVNKNGGPEKVTKWGQFYFVPGMGHCGGGQALDQFDMLGAMVNWVEKDKAPESVIATGKAFPKRSRPLCPYPKHAHYKGSGDSEDAANFECR